MFFSDLQFNIHRFNCLESTNIYAHQQLQAKKAKSGDIFWTLEQSQGKGQRGTSWQSEVAKNLLFSVVLKIDLAVDKQFYLSQAVALALYAFLDSLSVEMLQLKWPNDLLVNGEKIAGILIQNSIQGNRIQDSVVGIGLNVNQIQFEDYKRKATSLKLLKNKDFDLRQLLQQFLPFLKKQLIDFEKADYEKLRKEYLAYLYGYQSPMQFKDKDGAFSGKIVGVVENGYLEVEKEGELKSYDLKEVEFLD
ncbi:MAG: biotin--[acetyl-CoA-carboxylase] ligase [Vicingaceae bacterium]